MKNALCISMIMVLIVSLTYALCACVTPTPASIEPQADIAVMSDIHVLATAQMGTSITPAMRAQDAKGEKMIYLSEGMLNEGVDRLIQDKVPYLLISGDLTDDGSKLSHLTVAGILHRAEENGIQVFVVPGNHDIENHAHDYSGEVATPIDNISATDFAEIYADFGYTEAIQRHENTLSYMASVGNYRLLALDVNHYRVDPVTGSVVKRHDSVLEPTLLNWAEAMLQQAQTDGVPVIAMLHFPLAGHLTNLIDNNSVTADQNDAISALLAEYNVRCVFTGHLHGHDVASIETENATLLDLETASLCHYPMPIRYFKRDGASEVHSTIQLTSIKEKYIPGFFDAETKRAILEDLPQYSVRFAKDSMRIKVMGKIEPQRILKLLGFLSVDTERDEAVRLAQDIHTSLIGGFFDTPIYADGMGNSVEEICAQYDIQLPTSSYATVWDVAMEFLLANFRGNECYTYESTEGQLFAYSIYTAVYQIGAYDLLGKLHALNADIPDVDIMPDMADFFETGDLSVVKNNVLGAIAGSIGYLERFIERWSTKPVIGSIIGALDPSDSASIFNLLKAACTLLSDPRIDLAAMLPEAADIINLLRDLDISRLFDFNAGTIALGVLIEDYLFGEVGVGLITDAAPNDQTIVVPVVG